MGKATRVRLAACLNNACLYVAAAVKGRAPLIRRSLQIQISGRLWSCSPVHLQHAIAR